VLEKGFISEIMKYRPLPVPLGEVERQFLVLFSDRKVRTAYDIFLLSEKTRRDMAYSNVHKRIKRLEELGLIEFDKVIKRKAVAYKLTSRGLLERLLLGKSPDFKYPDILVNFGNNSILQTILYQFFEPATIKAFTSTLFGIEELQGYILRTSMMIFRLVEKLRLQAHETGEKFDFKYVNDRGYMINGIITRGVHNFVFEIVSIYSHLYMPGENKERVYALPNDALAVDKKFLELLKTVRHKFDQGCKNFPL
jgi:hypothetical protein